MERRAVVGPKVCGRDLYISDKPEGFVPGKLQRGWVVFINWCAISSCCREKPSLFFLSAVASTPNPPLGFSSKHTCPITRMWSTAHLPHRSYLDHSTPTPSLGFGPQYTCPIAWIWSRAYLPHHSDVAHWVCVLLFCACS